MSANFFDHQEGMHDSETDGVVNRVGTITIFFPANIGHLVPQ